jgi:hypothetical protein
METFPAMGHAVSHHGVNLLLLFRRQYRFGREHRLHVRAHLLGAQVGNLLHLLHRRIAIDFVGAKDFVQFHSPDLKIGPRSDAGLASIRENLAEFFRLFLGQSQLSLYPFVVKETEHVATEPVATPAAARASPILRPLSRGPDRHCEQTTQDQCANPCSPFHAILPSKFSVRNWFDV